MAQTATEQHTFIQALKAQRRFWTDPLFRGNVIQMMRALEAQEAREAAWPECEACHRKVESPCHSVAGYNSAGPWDYNCRFLLGLEDYA